MRSNRLPGKSAALFIALLGIAISVATPVAAQKKGGTLRLYHNDNPPSASLLEESTIASVTPFSAVFNNLVVFDPAKVHESLDTVIPDLAESWSWDATNTRLTFKLRQGVTWHDGKPFTAKDVQCTWRMLIGKSEAQEFHRNPRRVWYSKLQDVTINGDYEATFELSEPQPSLPVLLASAFSAVYPCHVPQATMRTRPVGTGPFKLVEFKRGASIRLVRNPDYWKKDRPYLDEITFRMIDSRATRMLAFATGEFDITFPADVSVPLMKDVKARAPNAICEMITTGTQSNLMVNRVNPPFDNPDIRKAMSLAIDRKAFNTILMEGLALTGGAMLPKPAGEWGMPPEMVSSLTGYGPDTDENIAEAREIMQKLGYSDAKPLAIKIQTRNLPTYRDAAVIVTDQLKKIYIAGELDILETPQWYARLARKDYTIGLEREHIPAGNCFSNSAISPGSFMQFTPSIFAPISRSLPHASTNIVPQRSRPSGLQANEQISKAHRRPCSSPAKQSPSRPESVNVSKKIRSTPPSSNAVICSRKHRAGSMPRAVLSLRKCLRDRRSRQRRRLCSSPRFSQLRPPPD